MFNEREETFIVGFCKECEYPVEECLELSDSELDEYYFSNYKNRCTNENCKEHKWHYVDNHSLLDYIED